MKRFTLTLIIFATIVVAMVTSWHLKLQGFVPNPAEKIILVNVIFIVQLLLHNHLKND